MTSPRPGEGEELRQEAIQALLDVIREPAGNDPERSYRVTKVSAASRLLAHTEWLAERESKPAEQLVELLGSPDTAVVWLRQMLPKLERLAASKRGSNAIQPKPIAARSGPPSGGERDEEP